jgi:hypothetical protein
MNDHSTRSAAESDPDAALANDPFLIGLDAAAQAPSSVASASDEEERLAAARAMLQQIETQADDPADWTTEPATDDPQNDAQRPAESFSEPLFAPAPESSTRPGPSAAQARQRWRQDSSPSVSVDPVIIPDGAIVSANGQPFRDIDAARFKARRLTDEAGEAFEVLSVAGGFVLMPAHEPPPVRFPSTPPPPLAPPAGRTAPTRNAPATASEASDVDRLTLADFPEGHPAHKYGLALYKTILKQTRKPLRIAWRSQLPLLIVAFVGVLVFLFPEFIVRLSVPPGAVSKLANPTFTKGISFAGLALALFVLGKAVFVRLNARYFLSTNYAKSEHGIVARTSTKLVYGTILATDLHQSVLGRLLNFGSVELSCAGSDGNEILIVNVHAPEVVQAVIESRMMEARGVSTYR